MAKRDPKIIAGPIRLSRKNFPIVIQAARLDDGSTTFIFQRHKWAKKVGIRLSDAAVLGAVQAWQELNKQVDEKEQGNGKA